MNGMIVLINSADSARGVSIAITGLVIVFVALILISLFIASLPRILELVSRVWPEVEEPHARPSRPEGLSPDEASIIAAIGFVLHTELQRQLAAGDTSVNKN